jgi:hypothetical protein
MAKTISGYFLLIPRASCFLSNIRSSNQVADAGTYDWGINPYLPNDSSPIFFTDGSFPDLVD